MNDNTQTKYRFFINGKEQFEGTYDQWSELQFNLDETDVPVLFELGETLVNQDLKLLPAFDNIDMFGFGESDLDEDRTINLKVDVTLVKSPDTLFDSNLGLVDVASNKNVLVFLVKGENTWYIDQKGFNNDVLNND